MQCKKCMGRRRIPNLLKASGHPVQVSGRRCVMCEKVYIQKVGGYRLDSREWEKRGVGGTLNGHIFSRARRTILLG